MPHTFYSSFHASPIVSCKVKELTFLTLCMLSSFVHLNMKVILNLPSSVETCWKLSKSLSSSWVTCQFSGHAWRLSKFETLFNAQFSPKCWPNTEIKVVHLCWNKQLMETGIINCICSLLSQLRTIPLWLVHICSRTCSSSYIEMFGAFLTF